MVVFCLRGVLCCERNPQCYGPRAKFPWEGQSSGRLSGLGLHFQEKHKQGLRSQQERAGWFGSPGYNLLLKMMYWKITGFMGYLEPRTGKAEVDLCSSWLQES